MDGTVLLVEVLENLSLSPALFLFLFREHLWFVLRKCLLLTVDGFLGDVIEREFPEHVQVLGFHGSFLFFNDWSLLFDCCRFVDLLLKRNLSGTHEFHRFPVHDDIALSGDETNDTHRQIVWDLAIRRFDSEIDIEKLLTKLLSG